MILLFLAQNKLYKGRETPTLLPASSYWILALKQKRKSAEIFHLLLQLNSSRPDNCRFQPSGYLFDSSDSLGIDFPIFD